uniref:SH3 domain-containing protein n=1 Tax=Strigamia maritima TaxID=126957 RepID=T1J1S0_STRMM
MSEPEDLTKLVDSCYKNILDKFNPGARQLISAGKIYLKALQAASVAARGYVDALVRLARNAQQATWAGASDVGTALMQMVDVYREVQAQHLNLLEAFYVDLLLPLESNLEKDTKVVQSEQKKFFQQQKTRQEAYVKAANTVKKLRKKSRSGRLSATLDKELKLQALESERERLETFSELSLHTVSDNSRKTSIRVRVGTAMLARQTLPRLSQQRTEILPGKLNDWERVARSRERLPIAVEAKFQAKVQENGEKRSSFAAAMRKTKSMDVSCMDLRCAPPTAHLSRAKSDFDLSASHPSLGPERNLNEGSFQHFSLESGPDWWCGLADGNARPRNSKNQDEPLRRSRARALYSYLSSGDHQLSFHEGDLIALIGQRNKGWQYGENLRSRRCGWFPVAYTEPVPIEELDESTYSPVENRRVYELDLAAAGVHRTPPMASGERRPVSMFVEGSLSRASSVGKGSDHSGSSSGKDFGRSTSPSPDSKGPTKGAVRRVGRSFTSPVPLLVVARPVVAAAAAAADQGAGSVHGSTDSGIDGPRAPDPDPDPDPEPEPEPDQSR